MQTYSNRVLQAELGRRNHTDFIKHTWSQPSEEYKEGIHTRAICKRIDQAIADYKDGISTFLSIKAHFRSGKSNIVARYLPANFIGKFPDQDIIVTAYSFDLVRTFSRFARKLMRSEEYSDIYPNVSLSKESQSIDEWGVEADDNKGGGHVYWTGLGGSVTGKGGSCIIVDDFFKSRQEAESETIRDRVWDSLTNDIMTRRAPTCIFIILATPWHVDDPFGRISEKMKSDPTFPRFEELKFPAFDDKYPEGVLFPERFSIEWYNAERAILGPYGTASLLQCDPILKSGNLLRTDKIKIVDEIPSGLVATRGWDLASSEKQRIKDDPDYTAGIKVRVKWVDSGIRGEPIPYIYVEDVVHGRWEAYQRNKIIRDTAISDGNITVGVEAFGPYKDAFTSISKVLTGLRTVKKMQLPGDKVSKASVLEPILEAGNFAMKNAPWNNDLIKEMSEFPGGKHDDLCDALVLAFECHNPFMQRVWNEFGVSQSNKFTIDFSKLDENAVLVATIHVDKTLKTSCLIGLWNRNSSKLYVFLELLHPTPRPEAIITKLSSLISQYSNSKKRSLMDVSVYGNSVMFGKHASISKEYMKYGVHLRQITSFDESGSIAIVGRLLHEKKIAIRDQCENLSRQMLDWSVDNNKIISTSKEIKTDPYGLCHSLNLMVSSLHNTGRMRPKETMTKPMKAYSRESLQFQNKVEKMDHAGKIGEFIVSGNVEESTGPNSWAI